MHQQPTPELVAAARQGSEQAWQEIYERLLPAVWRATWGFDLSDADREDVVQETFIRLIRAIHRYDPEKASLATYLSVIAKRICIDRIRREARRSEEPEGMGAPETPSPTDADDSQDSERIALLNEVMERDLSPEQRLCVKLLYYHRLRYDDIATILAHDYHWVKNTLNSARIALRGGMEARRLLGRR
jgi:RNA polymerase sigma-70 factor (ECF subfamily)